MSTSQNIAAPSVSDDDKNTGKEVSSPVNPSEFDSDDEQRQLTKSEARRIRLKTDLIVLPLMVITMTLGFLDKNGLSYAAVYGLKDDLNLVGQQYSWLGSIFYFGWILMEFPTMWIITKVPIGKFLGVSFMLWGIDITLTAVCHNFAGIATIRFFLGIFEAATVPCMLVTNAMWYRREEQPLRTAFWFNTFAGVFGGILSYAIGHIDGSLPTWKYIFIIYGAVTVLVGAVLIVALPDSPSTAWFLTKEERQKVLIRLADNQTGVQTRKKFASYQIKEAVTDPKCWCIIAGALAYGLSNSGLSNFNPLIISGYGFSRSKTVLMATPQAGVAFVAQIIFTCISYRVPNLRCLLWIIGACVGLAGAVMVHSLDVHTQRSASLAGVYLMGFYNVPYVFILSLSSSNTAGGTKKGFMGVAIAIAYAVGNIVGPQFFLSSQAPYYQLGIGCVIFAFTLKVLTGIIYYVLVTVENKRRDQQYGPAKHSLDVGLEVEERDITDGDNTNFRYSK